MTIGKGKRPRDPQPACEVDRRSLNKRYTGAGSRRSSGIPPTDVSKYMAEIGRRGGQIGGKRRLTSYVA
jgi:hypothetical protein